jgi:lysophospholipase L1-like esterase
MVSITLALNQEDYIMSSRIFWAGDSTVKQNDYTSYPQTGLGQGLPLFLKKDIVVMNRAENGRSTKSFIAEGRLTQIDHELREGDFLFIQFGHNDEKVDEERHTDAFSTYQENLTTFVNVARNHKAHPLFITSLYRRLFDKQGLLLLNTHLDYPKAMLELGKKLLVPVIDLCQLSKEQIQGAGIEQTKEWFLHLPIGKYENFPEGKVDNSHLQYQGAVTFAGIIAAELKKLGGIYEELLLPLSTQQEANYLLRD